MTIRFTSRMRLPLTAVLVALAGASCSPGNGGSAPEARSPYSAGDVFSMSFGAYYAGYEANERIKQARQVMPAIGKLYETLVARYRAQYTAQPCGANFQAALDFSRAPAGDDAHRVETGRKLADELKRCRASGLELTKAEATKAAGKDLIQMADGAMVVVAVTVVAGDAAEPGAMIAREAEALLQIDSRGR